MKNIRLLAISAILLGSGFGLASCGENSSKVDITFGTSITNKLSEVKTYSDFLSIFNRGENFIICAYKNCSCLGWKHFEPLIEEYNQKYGTLIYKIDKNLFYEKDTKGLEITSDDAFTLAIYENKKIKYQEIYNPDNQMFESLSLFETWMNGRINLPKTSFIDFDHLTQMYQSTTPFTVQFGRLTCGDCSRVDFNVLPTYFKNKTFNKKLYLFDVDEVRLDEEGQVKDEEWAQFKDEYGLSSANNPKFGYDTGYVPMFAYFEPDGTGEKIQTMKSAAVFVNDTVTKEGDSYKVTNSFYSQNRLQYLDYAQSINPNVLEGATLTSDDVSVYGEYVMWNYDSAEKYHNPLLFAFLDKYLK